MNGLGQAVSALESLAAGSLPDRAVLLAGTLALDSLCAWGAPDRDVLDAATGLNILARGGSLDLNSAGRERAQELAEAVRVHIPG
jgi:hypothetical protein